MTLFVFKPRRYCTSITILDGQPLLGGGGRYLSDIAMGNTMSDDSLSTSATVKTTPDLACQQLLKLRLSVCCVPSLTVMLPSIIII